MCDRNSETELSPLSPVHLQSSIHPSHGTITREMKTKNRTKKETRMTHHPSIRNNHSISLWFVLPFFTPPTPNLLVFPRSNNPIVVPFFFPKIIQEKTKNEKHNHPIRCSSQKVQRKRKEEEDASIHFKFTADDHEGVAQNRDLPPRLLPFRSFLLNMFFQKFIP